VEEVLELGVAEMRIDLRRVFHVGYRKAEGLNGPRKVVLTFITGAEGQALT
jgi:hypothetical protein